ncbi:MAG: hypothetical protein M1840_001552 [Geoglossum simile]|nr:MAG: hypothetical protein M1840_001552 [Geoglossum simile]
MPKVPATSGHGRPNRKGKKSSKLPLVGISEHDAGVLTKVKRRAHLLDTCLFNFIGIKFGWSSVIGVVPVVGDIFDMFMAISVINACESIDGQLDKATRRRIWLNIVLDLVIGIVPVFGDFADAMY